MTQLLAMPEVVSEAPHLMAMTTLEMSTGTRCWPEICCTSRWAASMPAWMAREVPPSSWMRMISTGLPEARISSTIRSWSVPSQPRLTISAAPTLGLWPRLDRVSVTRFRSMGSWQQPWWWK